jgi:membrane protease YdiL (CAAX protease family)
MRDDKKYWLDDPRNVNRLFHGLCVACALLLLPGLFLDMHPHFPWEGWFGFYAWYGFGSFVILVVIAKRLRRVLERDENYYD